MKKLVLCLACLIPSVALALPSEAGFATTVETAFGSVAAAYAEKLADGTYVVVDIINDTDCDVQVRFDDVTGTPVTVVPAGTFETLEFGAYGRYVKSSVSLQYMSGETCTSGSVYIKGVR